MVKGLLYLHLSFSRNHTLDLPTHTCTHTSFSYSFFSYKPDSCNWNHLHPSYPEAARVMFEKCTGVKVRRKEGKRRRGRGGFVLLVIIIYSPPSPLSHSATILPSQHCSRHMYMHLYMHFSKLLHLIQTHAHIGRCGASCRMESDPLYCEHSYCPRWHGFHGA